MANKLPPFEIPETPEDVLKDPIKLARWKAYWEAEEDKWNSERQNEYNARNFRR